jgi:para-nitrobenzyl esterase
VLNVTPEISALFGEGETRRQSEDCLVLNVWTPALDSSEEPRRPVMVWLHGGGFFVGSASSNLYDGTALSGKGVVVVSVNHRLGPLGYLHLGDVAGPEYAASGNAGMLDLVAALAWVRENIAAFGGDPDNVTIFGESGGGAKVSMLLAVPSARELFHKAIIQSGPGLRMRSLDKANRHTRALLRRLRIQGDPISALQALPAGRLIEAEASLSRLNPYHLLEPVVDGDILPRAPFEPDAPRTSADVPLIIGTNRDETTMFVGNIPLLGSFSRERLLSPIAERLVARLLFGRRARRIVQTYRRTQAGKSTASRFARMTSDWTMRMGSIRIAERKARLQAAPVYMYLFGWETPALDHRLGATHALDLPFVFDNVEAVPGMTGNLPEAFVLAEKTSAAWVAFARTGNPNHGDLPHWPTYDLDRRATLVLDNTCRVEQDPAREERLAWEGVRLFSM